MTIAHRRGGWTRVPPGTRVRLIRYGPCECGGHDDNEVVPPGSEGSVVSTDDAGTVHVRWDNGRSLGMIPGLDRWEVVREQG